MSAVYTTDERQIVRQIPVSEQALVHALKAFTDGEIGEAKPPGPGSPVTTGRSPGARDETFPASPTVYTNPEDIEFGKPKRRKRIYALVTTWKQSCLVPTKREGEFWTKIWKAWHERQGWKVTSHPSGYFATDPAGARVVISLHEYDKDSHERLT